MPPPSPPRPPVAVFDLDGTLAETAPDLMASLNHVMRAEGAPEVPAAEARRLLGAGARALVARGLARAGQDADEARLDRLQAVFLAHYERHLADTSHLFPGVVACLDRLAAAGWRLAVCTNKMEAPSRHLLGALGVAGRFAAILGRDSTPFHKPDPRHLLLTIEAAGGEPARSVMVGDSLTDLATARAAGVATIGVPFGYTDTPMEELGPDRLVAHFDGMFDALNDLLPAAPRAVAAPRAIAAPRAVAAPAAARA